VKDNSDYLGFILECIYDIHVFTSEGEESFMHDKKSQYAVIPGSSDSGRIDPAIVL
jgi:hypothetical protein